MKRSDKELGLLHRRFGRRTLFVGGLQLGFMGLLAGRMRYLQVEQADQYRLLAEENRINDRLIAPERGELFDRNGEIIAQNTPSYRIIIVREDAGDVDDVLLNLSQLVHIDPAEMEKLKAELYRSPPFLPITVADQVSRDDI